MSSSWGEEDEEANINNILHHLLPWLSPSFTYVRTSYSPREGVCYSFWAIFEFVLFASLCKLFCEWLVMWWHWYRGTCSTFTLRRDITIGKNKDKSRNVCFWGSSWLHALRLDSSGIYVTKPNTLHPNEWRIRRLDFLHVQSDTHKKRQSLSANMQYYMYS